MRRPPTPAERQWDDLSYAQRFAVWSIRLWLAERLGDETAAERSCTAFALAGAEDAPVALDGLMRCVSSLPSRPVRLAPVSRAALSEDEAALLRALAVAQAEGPVDGLLTLRCMFGPEGCRVVRRHCAEYARALASAGLDLGGIAGVGAVPASRHGPFTEAVVQ